MGILYNVKKRFATISLVLITTALASRAVAQEGTVEGTAYPLQVKYLSGDNETLVFDVKFENRNGSTFKMLVIDESTGATLFQDNYTTREFEKKLKIPRLTDTDYVTFLIRSTKENTEFRHKVKVTTKVADETVFLKNRELVSYK